MPPSQPLYLRADKTVEGPRRVYQIQVSFEGKRFLYLPETAYLLAHSPKDLHPSGIALPVKIG